MKRLLNTNNVYPKKTLGQNFIKDKNFLEKINKLIKFDTNAIILEIGPGKGALTDYLVKRKCKEIIIIEKDKRLISYLNFKYKDIQNLKILNQDALSLDYDALNKRNIIIIGNLPFNISTQLLVKWLSSSEWPPFYKKMILMFQNEVAERIIAKKGNKNFGRLSVLAQSRCKVKKLVKAPSSIFSPAPKVDGLILEFTPTDEYKNVNIEKLKNLLLITFRHRRKKIKTPLKKYSTILKKLNIDENKRPENLTVKEYCRLSELI